MISITEDSRKIKQGDIFVAIRGNVINGENFISDAIAKGASKIVVSQDSEINEVQGCELEKVENIRLYLSRKSAEIFPMQPKYIAAVTGTSGKTSTAFFFKEICRLTGHKSASIGTEGVISDDIDIKLDQNLTSPPPPVLHKILNDLAENEIHHVCMEASSHGLDQYRLESVRLTTAGFTNFSLEHLDYHKTLDEYFDAKMRLFKYLLPNDKCAVINADIKEFDKIKSILKPEQIRSYGVSGGYIKLMDFTDSTLSLLIDNERFEVKTPLASNFQKFNLMCSIGMAINTGIDKKDIVDCIPNIQMVPGRMQFIGMKNGARVYVDFAHKPDALEVILKSVKKDCKGKLYVVFGCGGDRDKLKRPLMGKIAGDYANTVIVTDDNPRTEDPSSIRDEIISGFRGAINIGDRSEAISFAMSKLKSDDVLIVAGKGIENYQIIGAEKKYFSDIEQIKKNFK